MQNLPLISLTHTSSSGFVYMTGGVLSFFPDPALIGVPDPSLNFLKPSSFYNQAKIVSCTNGLLLLDGEFSHKASLCLCNPATKEMVFVPKIVDSWEIYFIYKMGLAYDPCELPDRFTIIHPLLYHPREGTLYQYQFNVFCSDTGKWTRSSQSVSYSEASKAVCAKGVIYLCCGKYFLWLHATSWDGMLNALNFCHGMQLRYNSQSEMCFGQHIISPVGFYGQFVYVVVQNQGDTARLFRWEIATGRVEEKGQITVWEPWYINKIFKYANNMARVPQILNGTS
ncbi:putative F-box protein [Carex littledalei]|uniref:Putative F-box protein n=1 Tax=Carex littledalei TaxID=544730 RepID=A0A833QZM2_9POAL|nr:putative F-box protein [Carex littledalei]